jgi:CIC family chloride channel protein
MVSEMTAGYVLLVPLMLVTAVAYSLSPRRRSIYENQVFSRADSPAHTGDFMTDVLQSITVREVLREKTFEVFEEGMTLQQMLYRIGGSRQISFPVVDKDENLTGIISIDDIREVFMQPELGRLLIARDMANPNVMRIIDTEPLNLALRKFVDADYGELPVVSSNGGNKVIGMLSRRDLIVAYNNQMQQDADAIT